MKNSATRSKSRSAERLTPLRLSFAVSLVALAAVGCAIEGTGNTGGSDGTYDIALVARNTAMEARDTLRVLQPQIEQTQQNLNELTAAFTRLAQALAEGDEEGIQAAAGMLDDASRTPEEADSSSRSTPEGGISMPGSGNMIKIARANWSTGYMQAAIFKALLEELGYTVNELSGEVEYSPGEFYPKLANGEFDFWANGWFPSHDQFLYSELLLDEMPEERLPGEYVTVVGKSMPSGGLQGFLVDKKTADEFNIHSMEDVSANAALWDLDGNGKADIAGCNDGWGCQSAIEETLAVNAYNDTIEQQSGNYDELWQLQVDRLGRGEPVLAFTWTPSAYITQMVPGRDVYWMTVPRATIAQQGAASLPPEQCPTQPCVMGFKPADIAVVANNEFLAANPVAAKLLELVTFDVLDIALQNLRYNGGEDSEADVTRHAASWIADNRATVDDWLTQARAAT